MQSPIKRATLDHAPFQLRRVAQLQPLDATLSNTFRHSTNLQWTNYTINAQFGTELIIELLPAERGLANNITSFPKAPMCGSGGGDGGLCPSVGCSTMLYAMMGDCNGLTCLFGVASRVVGKTAPHSAHNGKVEVMIGWGSGSTVSYVTVDLKQALVA
jgi:hypothetical protein